MQEKNAANTSQTIVRFKERQGKANRAHVTAGAPCGIKHTTLYNLVG